MHRAQMVRAVQALLGRDGSESLHARQAFDEADAEARRRRRLDEALRSFRCENPHAPDWLLPLPEELGDRNARRVSGFDPHSVFDYRKRVQPDLSIRGAVFPGAGTLGRSSQIDGSLPDQDEMAIVRHWFDDHGTWHSEWSEEERAALHAVVDRPLERHGLVWRQHAMSHNVGTEGICTAEPGTIFRIAGPASCRKVMEPMGDMALLPTRSSLREGGPESAAYLEIWAHTGRDLGQPYSNKHEAEVLLPAGGRYEIIRHLDCPDLKLPDGTQGSHIIQVLQL